MMAASRAESWKSHFRSLASYQDSEERAKINALGFVSNVVFPNHQVSVGVRFFHELANRAAYQGYSLQLAGTLSF